MIQAGHQVAQLGYEHHGATAEYLDRAEALIYAARSDTTETDFAHVKDMLAAAVNRIEQRGEHDSSLTGAPSGLDAIDRYTSGFQPGQLVVIGGRTSKGKTALALDAVRAVGHAGGASAMFSLEMSKEELVERLFAAEARVNLQHIRTGSLEDDDWSRVIDAVEPIGKMGIEIIDKPEVSALYVRAKTRRLASKTGVDGSSAAAHRRRLPAADERHRERGQTRGGSSRSTRAGSRRWRRSSAFR